ncbi:MAG: Na/Pi cotransporter family protein [Peptococcaceae bacterium]|nr:Na/Pi cotransporter family protein [Peptococcaceae bacterium]
MSNEIVSTIFGLLGGLAVFLFGMNMMSEGLQKVAGEKMRSILGLLTRNAVTGVLAGAIVTAVLQSSSATTVMAIGFVSAGLLKLPQAISIIFGANIGTTMTAQLIAFKISDYIWPIIFIGFAIYFFAKKENIKYIGETIFAFGLLFLGIDSMGDVMKPLASSPFFVALIEQVADVPVLGVLVGTLMTVVVQSSSATIAVLQNFASTAGPDGVSSIIGLEGAIPILFGDNIGTTITALLASIGQSKNAKRTALSHSIFNISGSLVFIWFVPQFAAFVQMISPTGAEIDVISRQIANAHTAFNITNTLIWIPLLPLMVKIVTTLIPDTAEDFKIQKHELRYIREGLQDQPEFALHLVMQEIGGISERTLEILTNTRKTVLHDDMEANAAVVAMEDDIDIIQEKLVRYMSSLFTTGYMNEVQSVRLAGLMEVASNVERISDSCASIAHKIKSKVEKQQSFSNMALDELGESFELVESMVDKVTDVLKNNDAKAAIKILEIEKQVNQLEHRLRKKHLSRLNEGVCTPEMTVVYTEILHNLERIGDCCAHIAVFVLEHQKETGTVKPGAV